MAIIFWKTPVSNVGVSTDPGVANVIAPVSYEINGVAKVGTYVAPTAAQVEHGVVFGGGTGTYRGADLWSDPGANNVAVGVMYDANGVEQTGELVGAQNFLTAATLAGQSLQATLVGT